MPAKDFYHDAAKAALIRDGWTITHDPYTISFGPDRVFVDLGAERALAAEKSGTRIAVEIKSFRGPSELREFELALGQFVLYRSLMARVDPGRTLYLAIPDHVWNDTFQSLITRPPIEDLGLPLFVFRPDEEVIVRWTI